MRWRSSPVSAAAPPTLTGTRRTAALAAAALRCSRCPGRGGRSPRRMGAAFLWSGQSSLVPRGGRRRGAVRVVEGSPQAMRAVARAALCACVDDQLLHESLCLNSGRIGGAARGGVSRARSCRALGVRKRAASHRASDVRTLAFSSLQAKPAIFGAQSTTFVCGKNEDACHSSRRL